MKFQTIQNVKLYKQYLKQRYVENFFYYICREKRLKKINNQIQNDQMNEIERQKKLKEHYQKENFLLRSKYSTITIEQFTILGKIGQGATVKYFYVEKNDTKELLALKRMEKSLIIQTKKVENIMAERHILADHSSFWLVNLSYSFQDHKFLYLAMEFLPGGDLKALLMNVEFLDEGSTKFYAAEMLSSIEELHELGYLHRDIKPENFLIDHDGHIKLTDFGLSKKYQKELNFNDTIKNTESGIEKKNETVNEKIRETNKKENVISHEINEIKNEKKKENGIEKQEKIEERNQQKNVKNEIVEIKNENVNHHEINEKKKEGGREKEKEKGIEIEKQEKIRELNKNENVKSHEINEIKNEKKKEIGIEEEEEKGNENENENENNKKEKIENNEIDEIKTKESNKKKRKFQHDNRAKFFTVVGSPDYISPDILEKKGYTKSIDLWSFGCIFFEMLTGFPPFSGDTAEETLENVLHSETSLENPLDDETGEEIIAPIAWDLITQLLIKDGNRTEKFGIEEIKNHIFFEDVDWNALKKYTPPFVPKVEDDLDVSYFDTSYFDETDITFEIPEKLNPEEKIQEKRNNRFVGFSFTRFDGNQGGTHDLFVNENKIED